MNTPIITRSAIATIAGIDHPCIAGVGNDWRLWFIVTLFLALSCNDGKKNNSVIHGAHVQYTSFRSGNNGGFIPHSCGDIL
ncbi:hypothetical protein, partial [Chloroflexus sp.]|uniref:hypothetical protein n=1 Tax=Chloroflexus sp. TaxID=1904827 RepID=UPI00298F2E82